MFLNIERAVIQNKCLVVPQVYIRTDVERSVREKVKSVINDHHGYITGILLVSDAKAIQFNRLSIVYSTVYVDYSF